MKKFIVIGAVAISLTACNPGTAEETAAPTVDSTKVDTTVKAVDSITVTDSNANGSTTTAK